MGQFNQMNDVLWNFKFSGHSTSFWIDKVCNLCFNILRPLSNSFKRHLYPRRTLNLRPEKPLCFCILVWFSPISKPVSLFKFHSQAFAERWVNSEATFVIDDCVAIGWLEARCSLYSRPQDSAAGRSHGLGHFLLDLSTHGQLHFLFYFVPSLFFLFTCVICLDTSLGILSLLSCLCCNSKT